MLPQISLQAKVFLGRVGCKSIELFFVNCTVGNTRHDSFGENEKQF